MYLADKSRTTASAYILVERLIDESDVNDFGCHLTRHFAVTTVRHRHDLEHNSVFVVDVGGRHRCCCFLSFEPSNLAACSRNKQLNSVTVNDRNRVSSSVQSCFSR